MGALEFDLYINKKKVATFFDENTLRSVLYKLDYYDETKIIPYIINDLGERVEVSNLT